MSDHQVYLSALTYIHTSITVESLLSIKIDETNQGNMAGNVTVYNVGSFDFVPLYAFLQEALKNTTGDPLSSPYFQQGSNYISITNDVCLNITGSERGTWAVYDNQGIWNRIVSRVTIHPPGKP